MRFLLVGLVLATLAGCSARPLVIDWPRVQVQTNLPLSRQGVVIVNGAVDSPRVCLTVEKFGYYGKTILVRGLEPGGSVFIPADGGWLNNQTMTVSVMGYVVVARRDSVEFIQIVGTTTREFSFHNSGYSSRIESWRITDYDIRQRRW